MSATVLRGCVGLGLGLLAGCASPRTAERSSSPTEESRARPDAARIYTVGEERFAAGHYPEAVELWRHAILELPQTPGSDDLRHQLMLRLAYGQLMAWDQTRNVAYLEDAQQMLERYLARHEQLLGETEHAVAQRGEVYELLHQVEVALDPGSAVVVDDEPSDAADVLEDEGREADASTISAKLLAKPVSASRTELGSGDEAYVEDGEFHRRVVVRSARPSEDPATRARLDSDFANSEVGLLLTKGGFELIHGPRPLLRASGWARPADDTPTTLASRQRARMLGWSLLRAARPGLASCYDAAFARSPVAVERNIVELTVDAQGRVRDAQLVEGGLVDLLGELCLIEELESMQLAQPPEIAESARIQLPLTFFYQGPVVINESTGETMPIRLADIMTLVPSTAGSSSGLPSGQR